MTNFLTLKQTPVSSQHPLPVDDVTQASDRISLSAEAVTFTGNAAAASTTIFALDKAPILDLVGGKVGSHWSEQSNLVYKSTDWPGASLSALVETATSATATVIDSANTALDTIFETPSGTLRYVLKAYDTSGGTLYGWIKAVASSANSHTFDIYNDRAGTAQSWVGTLADFSTTLSHVEIYSYESSFVFGTGTVLTEEVALDEDMLYEPSSSRTFEFLNNLSNGQYAINYRAGVVYAKKATTGTSDTVSYDTVATASVSVTGSGASATLVDDAAFTPGTSIVTPVGYLADETTTDSVDEGDIGAPRMTLNRRQIGASDQLENGAYTAGEYLTTFGMEADDPTSLPAKTEADVVNAISDLQRRIITHEGMLHAGEDTNNNVTVVEEGQFSFLGDVTADTSVKSGSGFLHSLTFGQDDAAPTAGSIIVYDNTAESGTVIYKHTFTTAVFDPATIILDINFGTGLYLGFTTTADVTITATYR